MRQPLSNLNLSCGMNEFEGNQFLRVGAQTRRYLTVLTVWVATASVGCKQNDPSVEIISYKDAADPQRYTSRFEEACYFTDARSNWHFVMRTVRPAEIDPSQQIEQILCARVFWRPMPGKTAAEPSMTDAVVDYYLLSGSTGIRYTGCGFVSFKKATYGDKISGRIESCQLWSYQTFGQAADLLGRCELSGRFVAQPNQGRCVELSSRMKRAFGPPPPYQPRRSGP